MTDDRPHGGSRQQTIAAKLDPEQMARFERAVAAAGLSRSAFVRAAVLRQTVPLRPFEPIMAEALSTLAACRDQVRAGQPVDDNLIHRLDRLIDALHVLIDTRVT